MNAEPTRFLEHAETDAQKVIALAAAVPPRALARDGWDEVMERAVMHPPARLRTIPAFALSVALGVVAVLVLRPTPPPAAAPRPAELVAHANARWTQVAPGEISLQAGRLAVSKPGDVPIRVQTPHAVLETVRSRFLAEVTGDGTVIVVEEGEVVVRMRDQQRVVRAGESFVWPAPVIPADLLEVAPTGSKCAGALGDQLACLRAESTGSGLDAQAASYELGVLEARGGNSAGALETWRSALDRFPGGVLEPEVRLAIIVELVRAHRHREAVTAARAFEARFPGDARVGEVRALRESIERP